MGFAKPAKDVSSSSVRTDRSGREHLLMHFNVRKAGSEC